MQQLQPAGLLNQTNLLLHQHTLTPFLCNPNNTNEVIGNKEVDVFAMQVINSQGTNSFNPFFSIWTIVILTYHSTLLMSLNLMMTVFSFIMMKDPC